ITNSGAGASALTIAGAVTTTFKSVIGTPTVGVNIPTPAGANLNNISLVLDAANTGVLNLTAANTYAPAAGTGTTINGGTLIVSNTTGSGTGGGTVSVGASGKLGGTGFITGAVTSGGRLLPGDTVTNTDTVTGTLNAAVGTLTLSGGLTLNNGGAATFDFT